MTERSSNVSNVAALVNGLVMALLPLTFMLVMGLLPENTSNSTTVHASGASGEAVAAVSVWIQMWKRLLPLSLVVSWRTLVYARRWQARGDRGWRAVLEAGAVGFLYVTLVLTPAILRQPVKAPPYVIVYGGIGFVIGVCVGLVLRATALVTLKVRGAVHGVAAA
jgi:hypothetical protein